MQDNKLLSKIANHKILLYLVPNLICFYRLFYYYNQNFHSIGTVLFYEVILGCFLFLGVNTIIYFLLKKALKNPQKIFIITFIISWFYFIKMNLIPFLFFVIFILVLILIFKKFIHFNLDYFVGISSFIIVFLFSYTFLISLYKVSYMLVNSKEYNYELDFKVEEEVDTPNIYWIHCDGMMSQNTVKKYYHKNIITLSNFFENNDYFYNQDASMIVGHSTQRALVSMFNPYYYDHFYKDFVLDLEEVYSKKKQATDNIVGYYEIEEKRLHNELFQALKKNGYETIAIGDFSSYTSLYVDHYYDFFYHDERMGFDSTKKEFRYIKDSNSEEKLLSYIRFNHIRPLFYKTLIYPLIEDINYLEYNLIDYNDMDLNNYPYTNSTSYWFSKATFKGISESYRDDMSQFTFIDYKLSHVPFLYDALGNNIDESYYFNPNYYLGNYMYASNLLLELLKYIQQMDENGVIVVQGDHGIHTIDDEYLMRTLNTDQEGVQEIRNSVINAVYIPEKYRTGDEIYLSNPLNISRYLINNYVGENYEYID